MLQENDLLMSLTGNVGRVAFVTKEFLPAGLNQRVLCFRTDNLNLKKYLYYYFQSKIFLDEAIKNASGIAQLNMSTKWLGNYEIALYGEEKTKHIVSELDSKLPYYFAPISNRIIPFFTDFLYGQIYRFFE